MNQKHIASNETKRGERTAKILVSLPADIAAEVARQAKAATLPRGTFLRLMIAERFRKVTA